MDNIRVTQRRNRPRFLLEARQTARITSKGRLNPFQGNFTFQVGVDGKIDHAHAAAAQLPLDRVLPNALFVT